MIKINETAVYAAASKFDKLQELLAERYELRQRYHADASILEAEIDVVKAAIAMAFSMAMQEK